LDILSTEENIAMTIDNHPASARIRKKLREGFAFQISVDTDTVPDGLHVAQATLNAGIDIVELGTCLLKIEGVRNVIPIFRQRFPNALLLADMKTMDGGGSEAELVYAGGGNIYDFLALSGDASARLACQTRDKYRQENPDIPRLIFADILIPMQGPVGTAVDAAKRMVDIGVDGVGVHLQWDARNEDPVLLQSDYLNDVALAVLEAVGSQVSVQVVGGLTIERASILARAGLRSFVISGNVGMAGKQSRLGLPSHELEQLTRDFIGKVSTAV
jgi:3-keto-L-gulonate-6-phosphate decarboxylase